MSITIRNKKSLDLFYNGKKIKQVYSKISESDPRATLLFQSKVWVYKYIPVPCEESETWCDSVVDTTDSTYPKLISSAELENINTQWQNPPEEGTENGTVSPFVIVPFLGGAAATGGSYSNGGGTLPKPKTLPDNALKFYNLFCWTVECENGVPSAVKQSFRLKDLATNLDFINYKPFNTWVQNSTTKLSFCSISLQDTRGQTLNYPPSPETPDTSSLICSDETYIYSWIATCQNGVTTIQEVSGYPITTELTAEEYALVNGVTFGSWISIPCETDGMEMWSYTSYETTSGNCSFPEAPSTAGLSCGNYVRIANFMQWIPEATVVGHLTAHNAYNAYELANGQAQLKYDQREGKPVTCIYYSEIVKGLPLTSSSSESDAWFSSYYDAHQVPSGTARNNFYGENITDESIFYDINPIVRGYDPCPYDWRGFINEYKIKDSYAYLTTQGFMPSNISSRGWVNRVYGQNIPLEFHSVSNALHWMKVTRYSIDPNNTDIMNYQFPLKEDFSTSLFNGNPDYNFIKTDNYDIMGMSEEEAYRSTTILGYYECVSTSSLLSTNACSESIYTDIMYQCDGSNCTEIYRSEYAQGHREEKSIYYYGDIYGYLEAIGATTLYNKSGGDCNNTTFNNKIYARIAEYGDSNSATQANIHPVSSSNPAEFDENPNDLYYDSTGMVSFGVCANKQVYTTSTCYDMDWNWIPCPS